MITRIIRSLTGPGLDDPDPERRIEALDRQDPPLENEALAELSRTDPEASVRSACIARIDDPASLLALMELEETETSARDRLEGLISGGLEIEPLIAGMQNLAALRHLLDAAPIAAAPAVLARIDDEEVLTEIASHHRLAPIRAEAAARVISEDALRVVSRGARERDKDVARTVKARLDTLRDARAAAQDASDRIIGLVPEAEALTRSEDETHLLERLMRLERLRAESVEQIEATAPVTEAFRLGAIAAPAELAILDAAIATVRDRLEAAAAAVAAQAAADAAVEERMAALTGLVDGLDTLVTQVTERIAGGASVATERGPLAAAIELEDARWLDALGDAPAPDELTQRRLAVRARLDALLGAFEAWLGAGDAPQVEAAPLIDERLPKTRAEGETYWQLRSSIRERLGVLEAWLAEFAWPDGLAAPALLAATRAARDALATAHKAMDEGERRLQDRVGKLAGRMERALEAKKLGPVLGMQKDLKRGLEALPEIGERLQTHVDALRTGIEELRDWEYFATAPKREALCEAMETLAAREDLEAPARAEEVKSTRAAWNELGPVRGGEEGAALLKRFDAAAEQAFAPARAHFEAEAGRRAENTAQRAKICDELEQFVTDYDWASADWKAVERIYRSARNEWQRYEDVDREGRGLGKRYHKLSRTLKRQLEGRWQANIAAKEALITSAKALVVDGAPVPDSARQAKALQAQWKEIDITPRSADRKLWTDFRSACDAVFKGIANVRDQANAAQDVVRNALIDATRSYDAALEGLRARGAGALENKDFSGLPEQSLRAAMDALEGAGGSPGARKAASNALRAAKDSLGEARRLRQAAKANAKRAGLRNVLDHDVTLTAAEAEGGEVPAVPEAIANPWRSAFEQRTKDDAIRRDACVDLELALGCESPEEDRNLRLQRQVALLNAGMRGETARDDNARIETAIMAMIGCRGSSDESLALARRARAALDKPRAG